MASLPDQMYTARLHGARDMRVEQVPCPSLPSQGEVLLKITATCICGSDLHTYKEGMIGEVRVQSPLILGHEFAGVIEVAGSDSLDGNGDPLVEGRRVAVDPAIPCLHCELCEKGHPNLCKRLRFCGFWPDDGSLREYMLIPARCCFPIPDSLTDTEGALLEPLGVGIHAVDLGKVKAGDNVAILGAGPIGLLILQLVRLSGADCVFVSDLMGWRLETANAYKASISINASSSDPVQAINEYTSGRGVDVVFEAAWGAESVSQAAEIACAGGTVVLVGIPEDDFLALRASTVRRKGLTIKMSRRMKHTYPRAIRLAERRRVELESMVTHRFSLEEAPEAFSLNADYRDRVTKVVIEG